MVLTVSAHSNGEAFLEPTVLAPVPVEPDHQTLAVAQTAVLDLLLDAPPEESLAAFARRDAVMIAGGLVAAHLAGHERLRGGRRAGIRTDTLLFCKMGRER